MTAQITELSFVGYTQQNSHDDLSKQAITLLRAGNYQTCLEYLHAQPLSLVESSAQVLVYLATAMLFSEYPREKIFSVLSSAESQDDAERVAGEIAAIRAIIYSYTEDPEEGIRQAKRAFQLINPKNTFFRNIVERNLGVAYTIKNDLQNANYWLERLLMSSYQLKDWGGVLAAYNYLTFIRKVQGRLREAQIIYKKALTFIADHGLEQMPHSIKIISGYGHLLMYWHHHEEAKAFFQKAIQLAGQTDITYAYTAYQHLCETYIREHNFSAAQATLDKIQHCIQGKQDLYEKIHLDHTKRLETHLHLETGSFEQANEWLISSGFDRIQPNKLFAHFGYELGLTLHIASRIYLLKGMPDRAIEVLKAAIPPFIHQGAHSYLIRALTALAVAYVHIDQHQLAFNTFERAVGLAQAEDNVGDFLLMGRSLIPLLKLTMQQDNLAEFSFRLINLLSVSFVERKKLTNSKKHNSALSSRELDVLSLIADGMTSREIAQTLFLSRNTIKSHRSNIYRKLEVGTREQAINKAHLLGILAKHSDTHSWRVT
ncbi:MAG: LuxR C-terminal-related transcriptional regulator [Brevefilum sp.]